ncbi:hypothetical protein F0562_004340 [Nyssa sinensis]|uniref:non-specific serine/threonine protein kinase n=1 Tax=Nyssa sinensis TaxID=561372 RepID=A0A5J5C2Z7_9ASTE|nr:hypothetical protein F0562_004340 [Nyssa sinensis]
MEKVLKTPPKTPIQSENTLVDYKTPPPPLENQQTDQNSETSGNDSRKTGTPDRLKVPKAFKYPERYTSPTDLMMSPVSKGLLARSRKSSVLLPPTKNQPKIQDLNFQELSATWCLAPIRTNRYSYSSKAQFLTLQECSRAGTRAILITVRGLASSAIQTIGFWPSTSPAEAAKVIRVLPLVLNFAQFPLYGFGIRRTCLDSNVKLVGVLSLAIAKLTELRVLSLPFNDFSGEIPAEIWGMEKLEVLDLEGNLITGSLLSRFGGLRNLRVLNLGFNDIVGEIPHSLSDCVGLQILNLAGNHLNGSLPGFVGGFKDLRGLYLSFNRLSGSVPYSIGDNCGKLEHLELAGNFLVGGIPSSLGNCSGLQSLLLYSNILEEFIPVELGRLNKLEVLDVSRNSLSGSIPPELGNCSELSIIVFSNLFNPLPNITNSAGDSSWEQLSSMNDEVNYFEGGIPEEITTLPKLRMIWAPRATLEGTLPGNWGACDCLEMVNFAQNFFNGEISGGLSHCKKLHFIDLSLNRLTGELVENLPVPCMNVFDVSGNLLSGSIPIFNYSTCPYAPSFSGYPSELHELSAAYLSFFAYRTQVGTPLPFFRDGDGLAVFHNFGGNNFTGAFQSMPLAPDKLGEQTVYCISCCNNRISGQIPVNIGALCRSVKILDASGNQITGPIPPSLGDLVSLVALNLSWNLLQGQIPSSFSQISGLKWLSLAVPSSDPQGRVGGSQNYTAAPSTSSTQKSGNNGFSSIEIASITSASAIVSVLIALIILFFYTRKWNPRSRIGGSARKEVTVFTDIGVPLTYENVVRATGNFNASNCIGSGGFGATYKAEISPGVLVAIKRLAVGRFQGVQQFDAEIRTLGRLRHPNLVTLIGYHASETEMFLIYNYLSGGNLEKFIQERSTRAVDWKILHKIALDIARALAYLHDQCVPRVLHRDVKPSNILLDDDYNAYLSDFGLARLLGTSETHATTGVAGTFGYVAPEYAMTCRVSDKADVYSYGVVLLELISDKKALDPSFSSYGNGFNIVAWACMLLRQGRAKEFFTAGLWEAGPHDDLVEVLHLAVVCTVDSLSTRPTMKQVVRRLKQLQPPSC